MVCFNANSCNITHIFVETHYLFNEPNIHEEECNLHVISSTLYKAHLTLIIAVIGDDEQERHYQDDLYVTQTSAVLDSSNVPWLLKSMTNSFGARRHDY